MHLCEIIQIRSEDGGIGTGTLEFVFIKWVDVTMAIICYETC